MIDTKLIAEQRKVLINIIKRIGSNFLSGKSILGVSLPVEIFDNRSFLERMGRSFGHAPLFFDRAYQSNNIVEQLKHTAAFAFPSFMLACHQEKYQLINNPQTIQPDSRRDFSRQAERLPHRNGANFAPSADFLLSIIRKRVQFLR